MSLFTGLLRFPLQQLQGAESPSCSSFLIQLLLLILLISHLLLLLILLICQLLLLLSPLIYLRRSVRSRLLRFAKRRRHSGRRCAARSGLLRFAHRQRSSGRAGATSPGLLWRSRLCCTPRGTAGTGLLWCGSGQCTPRSAARSGLLRFTQRCITHRQRRSPRRRIQSGLVRNAAVQRVAKLRRGKPGHSHRGPVSRQSSAGCSHAVHISGRFFYN